MSKSRAPIPLRKALREGRLEDFIRQHESDPPGDLERLDKTLKRPPSGKSKEAPKASSRRDRDD